MDKFLEDLGAGQPEEDVNARGTTLSIWLTPDEKARFVRLQQKTRKRFGKRLRQLILAAITVGEAKAS